MRLNPALMIPFLAVLAITAACAAYEKDTKPVDPVIGAVEVSDLPASPEPSDTTTENAPVKYNEYNITLDINPDTGIVRGTQKILYHNKSGDALETVAFNVPLNAFSQDAQTQPFFSEHRDNIFPTGRDYGYLTVQSALDAEAAAEFFLNGTALTILLNTTLAPGESREITMLYEAYIPKINHRTGSNDYALWLGNFLPVAAVYEDGAFRTDLYYPAGDPFYSETSNYNVTVNTPELYTVVSTGIESVKEESSIKTTTITAKMVRDFALVIFDRSYRSISVTTRDGVEINMYYRSELSNIDNLIKMAETSLNYYSNTIGSYPYDQLDIVETGLFLRGGMEYSQMIFLDGNFLQQSTAISTLAHEIGHQWFYNVVGNDQVKNAWMDEGLTMMLQERIFNPDDESFQNKFETDYAQLSNRLTSANNFMLSDDLSQYKSWSDYYNTQYTKGKLMIYSLSNKMGYELFNDFIRAYYQRYSFKIASPEDFIQTAEEFYGESLEGFFDQWLNGLVLPPLYD